MCSPEPIFLLAESGAIPVGTVGCGQKPNHNKKTTKKPKKQNKRKLPGLSPLLFLVVFRPYPAVLRTRSWVCTQTTVGGAEKTTQSARDLTWSTMYKTNILAIVLFSVTCIFHFGRATPAP